MKATCGLAVLVLLCAAPAWAEGAATSPPWLATGAALCRLQSAAVAPLRVSGFTSFAICTAQCQDGSSVTCSGSWCNAVDADCPNFQQGYCASDVEQDACPPCEVCSDGDPCVKDSDCGTCFGAACFCRTDRRCICL